MTQAQSPEAVGPVLTRGLVGEAVADAIRSRSEEVRIIDRGAYLRVLAPGGCTLLRRDVERRLGREFSLPADLEEVMPSWKGQIEFHPDEVIWRPGAPPPS